MIATKPLDLRSNLKKYMDYAFSGEPVVIARPKNENVVMLSEKEYQAMLEKERPQMDPGRGVRKVGNFVRSRMEGLISSGRLPERQPASRKSTACAWRFCCRPLTLLWKVPHRRLS